MIKNRHKEYTIKVLLMCLLGYWDYFYTSVFMDGFYFLKKQRKLLSCHHNGSLRQLGGVTMLKYGRICSFNLYLINTLKLL